MIIDVENRKSIVIICTTAKMVRFFLVKHIEAFSKEYRVFVVCNLYDQENILDVLPDNVHVLNMQIKRNIDLLSDIKTLVKLIVFLYNKKVSAIYSISPKGRFLGVLAAYILRIPVRVITFTGQVWVTKKGVNRYLLKYLDKITSFLSTVLIVDSQSQRKFLESQGVIKRGKAIVIEHGSISGVDTSKFFPNKSARSIVRSDMNTPDDSIVFLFVGRLNREKGVFDLFNAFTKVCKKTPGVELWFVGDDEENVQHQLDIFQFREYKVKFIGYTTCPEKYMQAADVFCLTSYREGFGSSVIEAAACKIPTIGSNIYGLTDAIIDKKSGFLVNVGDVDDIAFKMLELSEDKLLRDRMGKFAYKNAIDKFDANKITSQLFFILKNNIEKSGGSLKIAIVTNNSWYAWNMRVNLGFALQKQGYEVVFICPYDKYSENIKEHFKYVDVKINSHGTNPIENLKNIYEYYKIYKDIKPDVVLQYTIKPNIYGTIVASMLNIPTINNIAGLGILFVKPSLITKIAKWLYKVSQKKATKIFFQNQDDFKIFVDEGLIAQEKCDVLPGSGVDIETFKPVEKEDDGVFRFLVASRMLWEKGIQEFVEAAKIIKQKYPNVQFQILGHLDVHNPSAISKEQMNIWVKDGYVNYLGSSDNVRIEISKADCIVLPSFYREGTPRILLESASMAKPIITTNNVGCRDVVDDGINGYLCEVRNAQDLASKMELMMNLPDKDRETMGEAGREKMVEEFSEEIVINKYLESISEIL